MLGIKFLITQNSGCGSLTFTDATGTYDAITNPTGYGAPNPNYSDISSTEIVFTLSNGTTKTFTNFLPSNANPNFTLYAGDLGYADIVPDQIAGVEYIAYGASGQTLGQAQSQVLFCCNFLACFYGQVQRVIGPQGCSDKELDRLWKMWVRFLGIQAAVQCDSCCASGAIEELNKECSKFCIECQCA